VKHPNNYILREPAVSLLAVILWVGLLANPGQAQQFNRTGYTVEIAQSYSPTAAAALGGELNCQVDMYNSCAGANVVQQNSGTGAYWHIAGYFMSANDPGNVDGSTTLSWVSGNAAAQDVRNFASSIGADLLDYVATANNVSGIAYQPGYYSVLSYASGAWYVVFAHELGHNFGCNHADGLGAGGVRTIMLHNYCGGSDINFYSNPSLFYNGIQLLGSLAGDCGTGGLANNGNNAGIVALAAPGKQNTATRPASTNTANAICDWTFTNAPGTAAAGTTLLDASGNSLTVRGNGAMFTGTGLRLPGGTTGNTPASSIAAYLDLANGIISSLTNLTLEIWATPIAGQAGERLFSFGQMSGPGDGLGATGEWTGTPGTPAPGATTAVNELGLGLADGGNSLATETLFAVTNSNVSNLSISVSTAAGTRHYYALTFQDGVGAYGAAGGRITCYRDDDKNPASYLDVKFHLGNLNDVNAWLGRSQYASDAMADVEYSEVRISNVALTPQQLYGNYLLGGGNARTIFNPLLTAVHCGGAAVGTLATDQRTFAADQNYTGGTAWDANGYSYAVDVSGVTNPAPQTAYQEQRYGNMTYTFNNYLPGTNYLVRLHCMECCWNASGQRVFNVFINGVKVLSNFDIYAAAGAQNKAVIREIPATADVNGKIAVQFVNVVDNASICAIEILQGGLYVPINLAATPGVAQVALNWSPVAGAIGYNVKRATLSGGPYVTVGTTTSTSYTDNPVAATTTYYYVVTAVNGGNESFNSIESGVTTPVTVNSDTWVGGAGNNFSTVANWTYSIGSGPVSNADALVFDSVGSTTPNNDETGYGYSTITFNPGAQAYTIGGNDFMLGTNSVGPVILVNGANPQTINNNITLVGGNQTISTASGNLTLGGTVGGTGSLTKTGAGTLSLAGTPNTLNSALIVGAGTLNIPTGGVVTSASTVTVGNAANNAVVKVSGGHLTGLNFNVGTVSGAVGAIYQNGGVVTATQSGNSTDFQIGNAGGAFGYYYAGAGTLAVNEIGLGGEANPGNALMEINGGTVNDTGWLVISRAGTAQTGILNVYSGSLNYGITGGGGLACNWGAGQTAILNILGGTLANTVNSGINLNFSGTAGNSGILNLNGGVVQAYSLVGAPGGRVNFNGGILKPSVSSAAFMTNLDSVTIYGGGATISNTIFTAITIGRPLLAPAGNGVNGIASFSGGTGYIAPPTVAIVRGTGDTTGVGATAIARINPASGVVTNVVITCPGINYTATPTFTVTGGGAATPATITGQAPTPNVSGGLTKAGPGILTLTNASTYLGATIVSGGKLVLSGVGSIAASANIIVGSGTIFDVTAVSGGYTMGSAQTLQGSGTVNGVVTVNGTLAPGMGTMGTLTLNNSPMLNGVTLMKINRNGGDFLNDQIKLPSSAITCGGTLVVTNLGVDPLVAGDTFQLFSATGYGGTFAATNLPPLGNNLYWTNLVALNGTLAVVGMVSTVPTNIVWSLSGTNLVLSWPADHVGWRLLVQTNHLASGISLNSNDWATIPNSPGTNLIGLPIDSTLSTEFYRLVYP